MAFGEMRGQSLAQPYLKPETVKVRQLVSSYRAGHIVIPEFQREYVWRKSKAPKLIDSLYRGFPISSLLLWQSSDDARARRVDPRPKPASNMSWLIDGQQRVDYPCTHDERGRRNRRCIPC
jgi:uncharacterized protein with ParB-like and HNH nuclease domain